MSNNKRIVEMTFEEFRQREQQTTKLAEELEAMRAQVEHLNMELAAEREKFGSGSMYSILRREAAKSIRDIRMHSNVKNNMEPIAWACWIDEADPTKDKPQICVNEPLAYRQRTPLYYRTTCQYG